jgi:hypothetical protein
MKQKNQKKVDLAQKPQILFHKLIWSFEERLVSSAFPLRKAAPRLDEQCSKKEWAPNPISNGS